MEPVYADRARDAGGVVHARLGVEDSVGDAPASAPEEADGYLAGLTGQELVDHLYARLGAEDEASLSVRALADRWPDQTRGALTYETLRKYIAKARKQHRGRLDTAVPTPGDTAPQGAAPGGYSAAADGEEPYLEQPVETGMGDGLPGARP